MCNNNNSITVIDSICGSGKTMYIFNYIRSFTHHPDDTVNKDPERYFIFVTPFLEEIERLKKENETFEEPSESLLLSKSKIDLVSKSRDLKRILDSDEHRNIAMSHSLFLLRIDMIAEFVANASKPYELIIDESPDIYKMFDLTSFDVRTLEQHIVKIPITDENDPDGIFKESERGNVVQCKLNKEAKASYKIGSEYNEILTACAEACAEDNVYLLDNLTFIYIIPLKLIRVFSEVKFLTYMFKGQFSELYLLAFGFKIKYQHVEKSDGVFTLIDGFKPYSGEHLRDKIEVIDTQRGKQNYRWFQYANGEYDLSKNWHLNNKNLTEIDHLINGLTEIDHLINGLRGYCRSSGVTKKNFLWTTFIDFKDLYEDVSVCNKENFCQCTARAINKYGDKTHLAYMINLFINSNITKFTNKLSVDVSFKQNTFSLSALIQWVFRSAIRNDKEIKIYIPSFRMRSLFKDWLNGEFDPNKSISYDKSKIVRPAIKRKKN